MSVASPSSRLILSNLPPGLTKSQLINHLGRSNLGFTDVQLITSRDGQSRRIGFVGFDSIEDATRASDYLNNSYLSSNNSSSKLKANYAKPISTNQHQPTNTIQTNQPDSSNPAPDDRLAEFLAVMNNKKQQQQQQQQQEQQQQASSSKLEVVEPVSVYSDEFGSDRDYLAARTATTSTTNDYSVDEVAVESTSDRLFVRNLAYSVTNHLLEQTFAGFGTISSIDLPLDYHTNTIKGFAYIQYTDSQSATLAKQQLDGTPLKGRLLHIIFAQTRNHSTDKDDEDHPLGIKQAKLVSAKRDQSGLNWATLYLNPDAVLESVANRLNIDKAALVDHSQSGSSAVKLALAETHIINETKQFFAQAGVNTDAFSFTTKRHPTTLLVKNLPFPTPLSTIEALFAGFGTQPPRILVPPSGTIAVVDLFDKQAANKAFTSLAYKQLGKSLLYLEKAPINIWDPSHPTPSAAPPIATATATATATAVEESPPGTRGGAVGDGGATLFVKNVSFKTTVGSFCQVFSSFTGYKFGRIQTKPDPNHPGQSLSMGFGFVGFESRAAAQSALAGRQRYILDGHSLEIQFAQRGRDSDHDQVETTKRTKEGTSNKLIVKNLPFEVSRNELRELFAEYGNLKSVRLPKKVDRKTRGFAFVEFSSSREANAAFNALQHTHLLGRHLVLQWANSDNQDIDKLRAKSALSTRKSGAAKSKFILDQSANPNSGVDETD